MKNIAFINCIVSTTYIFTPVLEDKDSISAVLEFVGSLPQVAKIVVLAGTELPELDEILEAHAPGKQAAAGTADSRLDETQAVAVPPEIELVRKQAWDVGTLCACLEEYAQGFDNAFYLFGDCPLYDIDLAQKMFENHKKYFAEYSFADGYPQGITTEIVKTSALAALRKLSEEDTGAVTRNTLFTVIQKDINSFDIETEISPTDLRLLRVRLSCDTRRNVLLTQKVIEEGGRDSTAIIDILEKKPEILRTLPAFFNIQIVEGCPQACFYCPYPSFGGDILNKREYMELDTFAALCKRITEFADDAVISVSLWGEPALHPHMAELVAEVARHPKLSLLIETSGIGWQEETLKNIRDNAPSTLDWIVSIDSYDQQLYHQLRGDGMKQALHTVDTLFELFPEHVYIQAVRMQLNEENLETFYREWKKRTDNIIIQKYDHFAGYLPQRKVTDLSPLKRFPCWHLKRDMVILLNGAVPLCREDIQSQYQLGNVFHDTIERLWNRGESFYREHLREEYNSLCGECDEYYTFNF